MEKQQPRLKNALRRPVQSVVAPDCTRLHCQIALLYGGGMHAKLCRLADILRGKPDLPVRDALARAGYRSRTVKAGGVWHNGRYIDPRTHPEIRAYWMMVDHLEAAGLVKTTANAEPARPAERAAMSVPRPRGDGPRR